MGLDQTKKGFFFWNKLLSNRKIPHQVKENNHIPGI